MAATSRAGRQLKVDFRGQCTWGLGLHPSSTMELSLCMGRGQAGGRGGELRTHSHTPLQQVVGDGCLPLPSSVCSTHRSGGGEAGAALGPGPGGLGGLLSIPDRPQNSSQAMGLLDVDRTVFPGLWRPGLPAQPAFQGHFTISLGVLGAPQQGLAKPGGLGEQKFIISQFWRLMV